jgi:hypothetical protein
VAKGVAPSALRAPPPALRAGEEVREHGPLTPPPFTEEVAAERKALTPPPFAGEVAA